jgi:hypothetical protein
MNLELSFLSSFSGAFKVSSRGCAFSPRLSHFFTTASSDTLALGVDVCIQTRFLSSHFLDISIYVKQEPSE